VKLPLDVTPKDLILTAVTVILGIIFTPLLPVFGKGLKALVELPRAGNSLVTAWLVNVGRRHNAIENDPTLAIGYCAYQIAAVLMWLALGVACLGTAVLLWLTAAPAFPAVAFGAIGGACLLNAAARFIELWLFYINCVLPKTD
jgi:hypothetical protein